MSVEPASPIVGIDIGAQREERRFSRPIYADETIKLEWLVVKVTPNVKLGGDIVELRGRIQGEDGQTALGAKGRVLVTGQL